MRILIFPSQNLAKKCILYTATYGILLSVLQHTVHVRAIHIQKNKQKQIEIIVGSVKALAVTNNGKSNLK